MKLKLATIMHFLCMCMVISLFLENIKLFTILGAQFKPTHVIFILAVLFGGIKNSWQMKRWKFVEGLLFLILPILPLYRINDTLEWFKSYFVWVIGVIYLVIAFPAFYEEFQADRKKYIKIFVYGMMIVQSLALVQFILMNFVGYMFLEDAFGFFQFSHSFTSTKSGFYRAYSLYHEPSFLGLMNGVGLACVLYTKKEKLLSKKLEIIFHILCALTMLVSLSAVAMYMYFITISVYFLMTCQKKSSFYGLMVLWLMAIYLWNYTAVLTPVKRIFTEYGRVNTSGYERLNMPMQYAKRTLQYYPFLGRGIGQTGDVDRVGWISTAITSTANNSAFEVIVNFGISSIFLFVLFFKQLIKRIKRNNKYVLITLELIGVLFSTGAYLSVDFLVILNFCFFLFS